MTVSFSTPAYIASFLHYHYGNPIRFPRLDAYGQMAYCFMRDGRKSNRHARFRHETVEDAIMQPQVVQVDIEISTDRAFDLGAIGFTPYTEACFNAQLDKWFKGEFCNFARKRLAEGARVVDILVEFRSEFRLSFNDIQDETLKQLLRRRRILRRDYRAAWPTSPPITAPPARNTAV